MSKHSQSFRSMATSWYDVLFSVYHEKKVFLFPAKNILLYYKISHILGLFWPILNLRVYMYLCVFDVSANTGTRYHMNAKNMRTGLRC